ncbi:monovalent cation/H(+) antiporter subunit G [Clostridium sp. CM028]|uniref:monovalent cation/H(+) antiporter subunit G n=1 Tax=unclassified Clostridium TaxID=2614128 RepID=UPI001C0E77B1|nr:MULTISPECIES: monovalent cation/H(+) antiporter subunit G [unclassified Clostridium]MBU3092223.1 monovalent cation/H(+) antiporter subunit G [Clostridium sp. CF011]MBW9144040.1 monovalent cation/H(+) antiporter subunit G [Clostridium sp. CM027]MBW9147649.1 monovalent cation/H(+) antiporter subunit G [Clostridium sp. CM028]UVE41308.1 monovalent cation/H(+) antiporter subunit G [Clostridium sp. CM027]WAG70306.1 monovalent cation/H(+) antiporter subunit G [Clostridium sp. CF011]
MRELIVAIFLFGGLFFFMVGTLGIIRFPDVFTRAHSAAKCDTLGAILCLSALVVLNGLNMVSLKIVLIIVFVWIANPTATHLIAKAEYTRQASLAKINGVKKHEDI